MPSSSEVEHLTVNQNVAGSIPAGGAMLTVAQLVEHWIVIPKVASSSLVCRPNREVVQLGRTRALGA